ncbi:hypothetical protein K503DRAFT_397238 [Rhizopogon vinicolor AM-OR11-026]|uniref:Uncharacterized protein n=1 Tax=Rhizopogon vinicolor AM-OR11-026 TaxID=1314800 RepID=A0A1B7MR46_9AGAM|nr:hypothetical protein K503DRAFT_397238 [Rhizopogon vinicolor AM-OR11-026]
MVPRTMRHLPSTRNYCTLTYCFSVYFSLVPYNAEGYAGEAKTWRRTAQKRGGRREGTASVEPMMREVHTRGRWQRCEGCCITSTGSWVKGPLAAGRRDELVEHG